MLSCKDLKIFLWDIEQYFGAAHILLNKQVTLITMYLSRDAKSWWRTRSIDNTELEGQGSTHERPKKGVEGSIPSHKYGLDGT